MSRKELTLTEAKELLKIDKHRLDDMVMEQASLYDDIGDAHVMCMSERDMAKEALAEVDAVVSDEYRDNAITAGEKVTESALLRKVQQDTRHSDAYETYAELKLKTDRWGVLKDSFGQRASMVKHLCELYNNQYYTREAVKGDRNTEEVKKEGRRKIIDDMGKRKRVSR
jgi:hypothetical protein